MVALHGEFTNNHFVLLAVAEIELKFPGHTLERASKEVPPLSSSLVLADGHGVRAAAVGMLGR
jgi:hypothetical protein